MNYTKRQKQLFYHQLFAQFFLLELLHKTPTDKYKHVNLTKSSRRKREEKNWFKSEHEQN